MKVYVVYGNLNRTDGGDFEIFGVFRSPELAEIRAEQIASEAIEKNDIGLEYMTRYRSEKGCPYYVDIYDKEDFQVDVIIVEKFLL